ncbi:unnamed protein product [Acanthoscelides obtectus]|uniref:THAP-type domain-containing protein n=1 Tax=Acanthoscelides obtectus TaxID=200917 RepID=A0A9P0PMG1_ACAOB|nr:unnamed protein product [Acanthoscelides obtectus]CAK1675185.1 Transposable element P transposase [Acanthoscelides obtectus]
MKGCAVANCKNYNRVTKGSDIGYFRFPKNEEFVKRWVGACRREDEINLRNACICSEHFDASCFEIPLRQKLLKYTPKNSRYLKPDAVPTLRLPGCHDSCSQNQGDRSARLKKRTQHKNVEDMLKASTSIILNLTQQKSTNDIRTETTTLATAGIEKASDIQIKTLKERIVVLEKQNKALTEQVEKIEEKTALKYKDVLAKVFTPGQIKKLLNAGKKRVRWSPEDIATAISLRSVSPKAYRYLRVNNYPLPALSTLRSWVSSFDVHQGILKSVITLMQKKSLDCTEADRICVLSFDEMYVSNKIEIDKKTEQIIGPHRCCQTVMVRGLLSKWKQPIYYEFDQSMMKYIIEKIVAELFRANFIVVAITSDMGTGNTGLWSQLEALYLEDHVIDEDMLKLVDNYEVKEKIHHDSLKYVAGFVAYKFKHKYNLGNPTNTFERNIEPDWLETISRGSLLYPNDELYEATLKLESVFYTMHGSSLSKENQIFHKLAQNTLNQLKNTSIPFEVLLCLSRTRTYIRLRDMNRKISFNNCQRTLEKKMSKFVNFRK